MTVISRPTTNTSGRIQRSTIGAVVLLVLAFFLLTDILSSSEYTDTLQAIETGGEIANLQSKASPSPSKAVAETKPAAVPSDPKKAHPHDIMKKRIFHHAAPHSVGKSGMIIHDQLLCHAYAWHSGAEYGGACGAAEYDEHIQLLAAIGLQDELPFACPGDYERDESHQNSVIQGDNYKKDDTRIWIPEYLDFLKTKVVYPPKESNKFTIAVHIKRGKLCTPCRKLKEGYQQYLPNSHYQRLIDEYMQPDARVVIFSQSDSYESFDEFEHKGYELHLDHDTTEVWKTITVSDVVILSRSSFGLLPALVTNGTVVYTRFWHKPIRNWHIVKNKETLDALETDTVTLKKSCP